MPSSVGSTPEAQALNELRVNRLPMALDGLACTITTMGTAAPLALTIDETGIDYVSGLDGSSIRYVVPLSAICHVELP